MFVFVLKKGGKLNIVIDVDVYVVWVVCYIGCYLYFLWIVVLVVDWWNVLEFRLEIKYELKVKVVGRCGIYLIYVRV